MGFGLTFESHKSTIDIRFLSYKTAVALTRLDDLQALFVYPFSTELSKTLMWQLYLRLSLQLQLSALLAPELSEL